MNSASGLYCTIDWQEPYNITFNVPAVDMAWDIMVFFDVGKSILSAIGRGWALKIETLLSPEMTTSEAICFWVQKSRNRARIKKKKNFPHTVYKEIQKGAVAKSYMRKGLIYEEMRKYLVIYEESVSHIQYDFATAPFLYMRKIYFLFYQCAKQIVLTWKMGRTYVHYTIP